jgi:hypothetical protein
MIPVPRGASVPIEPRMAGVRKGPDLPKSVTHEAPPAAHNEAVKRGPVCFQCPNCAGWLRIEDPMNYTGLASECPSCKVAIIGPRLA